MVLSEGERSDHTGAALVLDALPKARAVGGGRGDGAQWLRQALAARGIEPGIPSKTNRKAPIPTAALLSHILADAPPSQETRHACPEQRRTADDRRSLASSGEPPEISLRGFASSRAEKGSLSHAKTRRRQEGRGCSFAERRAVLARHLEDRLPFLIAYRAHRQTGLADELHLGQAGLGLDLLQRHRNERLYRLDGDLDPGAVLAVGLALAGDAHDADDGALVAAMVEEGFVARLHGAQRSEEHTSELQSLLR